MGLPTSSNIPMTSIAIIDDFCFEEPETFTVDLTVDGRESCVFLGSPSAGQITITDDDCKSFSQKRKKLNKDSCFTYIAMNQILTLFYYSCLQTKTKANLKTKR